MTTTMPATLDAPQTRALLESDPRIRLIDVRTPGEFAAAHIPGSANVPLDLLRAHQDDLTVAHEDPVVLVCASGARAEQARTVLASAGMSRLGVLDGGVTAWQRHDGPVNRGAGTWDMERQVRLTAGLLVLTGVLGSRFHAPLKWIAGFIGGGLTFSAVTNTCGMARVLSLLPHNRVRTGDPQSRLEAVTGGRSPARPSSR